MYGNHHEMTYLRWQQGKCWFHSWQLQWRFMICGNHNNIKWICWNMLLLRWHLSEAGQCSFCVTVFLKNLTLEIQGQGHGRGQSSKWQSESHFQSTHVPFVPCQSAIQCLEWHFSKSDLENPRSRSWVRFKVTQLTEYPFDVFPFF